MIGVVVNDSLVLVNHVNDLRHRFPEQSFRSIVAKLDEANLKEAIDQGHVVLEKLEETLTLTNRVLKPNSPLQYNVIKLTGELEETARSIRQLVETLERNPQAIIFGKDIEGEE